MWIKIDFRNQKFNSLLINILTHDITNVLDILSSYQSFSTLIVNLELFHIVFSLFFVIEITTHDIGHFFWLYFTVFIFIT